MPEVQNKNKTAMTENLSIFAECYADIMPVRTHPHIWEWAEQNLVIPSETGTPWAGEFRVSNSPWTRGLYDIIEDHDTRLFAIQKGSQVGITQVFINCLMYWIAEDPGACLYVMDSLDNAIDTSKLRLKPIMRASARISDQLTKEDQDLTNVLFRFRKTFVRLIGANSPGKGSSFTHKRIIFEEPEKYKDTVGKEGNVIENIMERSKRVPNSKILIGCTPSTPKGFIAKYVAWGDACKYFCPCPKCGHWQTLEWSNVKTDKGELDTLLSADVPISEIVQMTYLECVNEKCRAKLNDNDKRAMSQHGEWRPTKKPERRGYRSALLGGMVPFNLRQTPEDDASSIRAFTEKYLTSRPKMSDYQVFINSWVGDVWEERERQTVKTGYIYEMQRRLNFDRGALPFEGKSYLVLCVDVQKRYIPWSLLLLSPRALYVVNHGASVEFSELQQVIDAPVKDKDGNDVFVRVIAMDSGYRTTEVYNFLQKQKVRAYAIKGEGTGRTAVTSRKLPVKPEEITKYPDGVTRLSRPLQLLHISDFEFTRALMDLLVPPVLKANEAIEQALARQPLALYFHKEIDQDFVKQMTSMVAIETEETGVEIRYKAIRKNDYFDTVKIALSVHYLARATWDKMEWLASREDKKTQLAEDKEKAPSAPEKKIVMTPIVAPKSGLPNCPRCGGYNWQKTGRSTYVCKAKMPDGKTNCMNGLNLDSMTINNREVDDNE